MFKGFYNLTSGMLSQSHRLDVVANNMTNVATPGYKADQYTDSTFREYMLTRVNRADASAPAQVGPASYILAPSQLYTDYTQGALEGTGMPLDFAIDGEGFFAIQSADGVSYTRSGSFTLDEEGYLTLPGEGRVLDMTGQPIYLLTDQIDVDASGSIYDMDGIYLGQLGVYTFQDNAQLARNARGLFVGGGQAEVAATPIQWKTVERANVDLVDQMVQMISAQRALQSAAQLSKMYDRLMDRAANDLGRL